MHQNYRYKTYLDSELALHIKCSVDRFLEVLFAASPEGPKRICLPQLNRKAIPKNCSRVTETIFHKVCMEKRNSKIVVGVSQRVTGDIAMMDKFRKKIIWS